MDKKRNLEKQNLTLKISCAALSLIVVVLAALLIAISIADNTESSDESKNSHISFEESVLERHDLQYYDSYVRQYLIIRKKFNVFEDEFNDRAKFIISVNGDSVGERP